MGLPMGREEKHMRLHAASVRVKNQQTTISKISLGHGIFFLTLLLDHSSFLVLPFSLDACLD